jgi:hypothetical protein
MRRVLWTVVMLLAAAGRPALQERTLRVPANVTVDGVPAIPMSLVEAVAPYAQFRQARLAAWHPIERRILISTTFANLPQLHQVRFPGGARTQLTFFSDGLAPRPGAVFGPKGDFFVFQKDTAGGGEANQLFRYDAATGAITLLTDGTSRNGAPAIARGGRIAYESTKRDGKNRDLYVANPLDPSSARLVAEVDGAWSVLDWSRDEKTLLALQVMSSSETYLWKVDVASGSKTLITPKGDRPVRWSAAAIGTDGETFAVASVPSRSRVQSGRRARVQRRVFGGCRDRPGGQVDVERDGRREPGRPAGRGNRHVARLRRADDFGSALPAQSEVHRTTAGDHQRARRARRARAAAGDRPEQLFPERAGPRRDLSEHPRFGRVRPLVRGARQRPPA